MTETTAIDRSALNALDKDEFGKAWLAAETAMRDSLTDPVARKPKLCEKHQKPISQRAF